MANKQDAAIKKHSTARTIFQAAWFALTNGYARGYTSGKIFTGNTKALCVPGLNCYSCPGALASCPIGSLQAVFNKGTFKISLYVFGLLSMFGVVFGRLVCSWMCPFGLVQDLLHKIPLGPKFKNLPGHKYLRWLRFVVLAVMVVLLPILIVDTTGTGQPWFCEWICPSGTLLGGIPLTIVNEEFRKIIGFRFFWKVGLLAVFCLGAIWWYRPFCKYLCPLGAIYGVFNPVSTYRLEIDAAKCVKCKACQKACGMDIPTFETPNSMDCIRCGDCMKACPTGAISSTWGTLGQNIKSRCFIDDEAAVEATVQSGKHAQPKVVEAQAIPYSLPTTALRIMGIVMVVGGIIGAITSFYLAIYADFNYRLTVEALTYSGPATFVLDCMKVAASVVVAMAGIYVLRNIHDNEKLLTVSEKLRTALLLYLFGLLMLIINAFFDLTVITLELQTFYACYPALAIPVLWGFFACATRYMKTGKLKVLMWVLYVLAIILSIASAGFAAVVMVAFILGK